jgi:hypothetical protein
MTFLRRVVALGVVLGLATALPASALSAPTWATPRTLSLPVDAVGIPDGFFSSLSCASATNCAAAGSYSDNRGRVLGMIATDSMGVWKSATALTVPAGAGSNPGVTLYQVSCGAVGNCSAAGSYSDAKGDTLAYVDNERGGRWLRARTLSLPANALVKGQDADLRSVSCRAANTCSAVGVYQDNNPIGSRSEGFVANERRGVWSRAHEVLLPASNFNPFVTLSQIACSSSTNCVGVGSFINANDVSEALAVDEVHGAWRRALALGVPEDASRYSGASASEVSCLSGGSCAVFGTYLTTSGATEGLSASETNAVWSSASALSMPANAAANPHVFVFGFDSIACSSPGNCSVGGQYQDTRGAYQGFLENEVGGVWQAASQMQVPSGTQSGQNGGVVAVQCPSDGNCVASGSYLDASGAYQPDVVSEVDGTWQRGAQVPLPSGATTVGTDGGIYAIHCATATSCVGIGSYLRGTDTYEGFTLGS